MMLFYKPGVKRKEHPAENFSGDSGNHEDTWDTRKVWLIGAPVGGIAGFIGGLLGVGGGNIIVPALIWLGISPKKASATSAFIVIFSSLSGFVGRATLGSLNGSLLAFTVAGSVAGALLGAWLMSCKLQNRQVKLIIGILLYLIAGKMLLGLWH